MMYEEDKLFAKMLATAIRIRQKFPHHTKEDKKDLKRARSYIETWEALVVLKAEVEHCRMMEYQEAKKVLRETL